MKLWKSDSVYGLSALQAYQNKIKETLDPTDPQWVVSITSTMNSTTSVYGVENSIKVSGV